MHTYEVLRRPLVTEKNSLLQERNKYCFEVAKMATKRQVKEAVELAFKVKVTGVNVLTVPGNSQRMGRRMITGSPWKKAIVTLAAGNKIQLFEGV